VELGLESNFVLFAADKASRILEYFSHGGYSTAKAPERARKKPDPTGARL